MLTEQTKLNFIRDLQRIRLQKGITQTKLSEMTGVRQTAISRLEKGETNPRIDTVVKIAHALGMKIVLETEKSS